MFDIEMANRAIERAKGEDEIFATQLKPFAKSIGLYKKENSLIKQLQKVIIFERKKSALLLKLYKKYKKNTPPPPRHL